MTASTAKPPARPSFLDGKTKLLLIDGRLVPAVSGKTFETINPTTGAVLARVAEGDAADIDLAVEAARRALEEGPWGRFKPFDRQEVLLKLADLVEKHFDEIAMLDTLDMGGPIASAPAKKRRAVGLLRFNAGLATSIHGHTIENSQAGDYFSCTMLEPVGVVGAITAWNGPAGMTIWKLAPALAAGCTIVLKPSEQAPLSPMFIGQLCLEAGIPPGVVNVVPGYGKAGAALAAHPGVDKVAFTGSTATGQQIIRDSAGNVKRVSLELGGKSPDIVFADADLDAAIPGAAMAVFVNSGQICSAGTRMFVEESIYEEFVHKVGAFAKALRVGDPTDANTQIGPLVSSRQLERVSAFLKSGPDEGARTIAGGARLTDTLRAPGYFIEPTVFADVRDGMSIARDEIFGPVISALSFKTVDEVLKRSNATSYGLGCGVWTSDMKKALRVTKGLRAGTAWVNCYGLMDPAVPFGGYKMSGYGRESGVEHIAEFLNTKAMWMKM